MIRFSEVISTAFLRVKNTVAKVDSQKGEVGPGLAVQSIIPPLRKKRQKGHEVEASQSLRGNPASLDNIMRSRL